jgi:prevent-host-death family protein
LKSFEVDAADLDDCVKQARKGQVVLTRNGRPVGLLVSIESLYRHAPEPAPSQEFWKLIEQRRREKPITPAELELRLAKADKAQTSKAKPKRRPH